MKTNKTIKSNTIDINALKPIDVETISNYININSTINVINGFLIDLEKCGLTINKNDNAQIDYKTIAMNLLIAANSIAKINS